MFFSLFGMEQSFVNMPDTKSNYFFATGMVILSQCVFVSNLKVLIFSKSHYFLTILIVIISILFYISNIFIVNLIISFESYGIFDK